MEKRFGFIRLMAVLFVVGGFIAAGYTVLVSSGTGSYFNLGLLVGGLASAAFAVTFGLLIEVLLAIEESTRATSQYLEKLASRQRPAATTEVPAPTMDELQGSKRKK